HMVSGYELAIRFEQDTSGGDTAQTWDLAANDDEFSLTDVTNSSAVPLLIEAGTPADTIYVDSAGYVGLGTNSPSQIIHIKDDANPAILIENPDAYPDGDEWVIRVWDDGSFRLSEVGSGVVELLIDKDGTVELVEVFELQPDGDLIIDGALTTATTTYPDYVFEDDYPLMPLPDLAGYIAEHRHLPNVPTVGDVDGGARVNMSELQISLLRKVEELTLYTLSQYDTMENQQRTMESQQRTIDNQQEVIRELQAHLLALEERVRSIE
ncbi:MAG: SlyX family protein, partial [bacterium]|nr:SlyX family protein [bacterium]